MVLLLEKSNNHVFFVFFYYIICKYLTICYKIKIIKACRLNRVIHKVTKASTKTPILVKTKIEIKKLKLKNHMFKMGLKIHFITKFGAKISWFTVYFSLDVYLLYIAPTIMFNDCVIFEKKLGPNVQIL